MQVKRRVSLFVFLLAVVSGLVIEWNIRFRLWYELNLPVSSSMSAEESDATELRREDARRSLGEFRVWQQYSGFVAVIALCLHLMFFNQQFNREIAQRQAAEK